MALNNLVYDRSQADLAALKQILAKVETGGLDALDADEVAAIKSATNKGAYNYGDIIRVIAAVNTLVSSFAAQGYNVTLAGTLPVNGWTNATWVTPAQAAIYLANVEIIRSVLPVMADTPTTPETLANLTFEMANAIEKILFDVSVLIDNMIAAQYYAGDLYAGEV